MLKGVRLIIVIIVLAVVGGGGWFAWSTYWPTTIVNERLAEIPTTSAEPTNRPAPQPTVNSAADATTNRPEPCSNNYYQTVFQARAVIQLLGLDYGNYPLMTLDSESEKKFEKEFEADPGAALATIAGLDCLELLNLNIQDNADFFKPQQVTINSISNIPDLPNLKALVLYRQTKLQNLSGLERFSKLQLLDLSQVPITDLSPLTILHDLQYLNLDRTLASDLTPLAGLVKMKQLNINREEILSHGNKTSGHLINDLSPLAGMTDLRALWAKYFNGTNVTGLAQMLKLSKLDVNNASNLTDITALTNLREITKLNIAYTNITDLSPLKQLTRVKTLLLVGLPVQDLSPLATLTNLETLDAAYTPANSIAGFNTMTGLHSLDLTNTAVADISPLLSLNPERLTEINISSPHLTESGCQELAAVFPQAECRVIVKKY